MNILCNYFDLMGSSLCATPVSNEVYQQFIEHMSNYGLSYGTDEEFQFRLNIFNEKYKKMKEINASQDSFIVGHNQFSTMTDYEYKRLLGNKINKSITDPTILPVDDIPDSIDWRAKGAVTPIKDQGYCGSCWGFATTASVEGHHFIQKGELLSLAE